MSCQRSGQMAIEEATRELGLRELGLREREEYPPLLFLVGRRGAATEHDLGLPRMGKELDGEAMEWNYRLLYQHCLKIGK